MCLLFSMVASIGEIIETKDSFGGFKVFLKKTMLTEFSFFSSVFFFSVWLLILYLSLSTQVAHI